MEKIKCACIRYTTKEDPDNFKYLEGPSHEYCRAWFSVLDTYPMYNEEGFLTDTCRFVYRSEAYDIAKEAGQIRTEAWNGQLYSYNVIYEV